MHIEQVFEQLRSLRLSTMAESLQNRLQNGNHHDLSHEEFVALLVEDECNARNNRRLSCMIGNANFKPEQASIENITYNQGRGFMKKDIMPFTSST